LELNGAHANIHVFFAPYRPDAASVMDMFDVFVMPSRYEGYGLALTEAMTLGLPVVCSSADSLPELCALYKGYSRIADFSGENEEVLADTIVHAASVGKSRRNGHVIKSISEMLDEYLIVLRRRLEPRYGIYICPIYYLLKKSIIVNK
jgi:glycosyltransferase involved in cell wall biosynthesis